MVASMTGFANKTLESSFGNLSWEVRSVNHRYLEISTRMPENFRALEMEVRGRIQTLVKRGKVEATLKFAPGLEVPFDLVVNESMVKQLHSAAQVVNNHFKDNQVNTVDILNWPGVLDKKQTHTEELQQSALALLDSSLQDLCSVRQREGQGLKTFIEARLDEMKREIKLVEERLPLLQEQARTKLHDRFSELNMQVDSDRLEQEIVLLLQKMDVAEEIQRLHAHIDETQRVLAQGQLIGRRLDFLMQEFNREANTLGSKSSDAQVTKAVVELKVQIEQTREQVQNIE